MQHTPNQAKGKGFINTFIISENQKKKKRKNSVLLLERKRSLQKGRTRKLHKDQDDRPLEQQTYQYFPIGDEGSRTKILREIKKRQPTVIRAQPQAHFPSYAKVSSMRRHSSSNLDKDMAPQIPLPSSNNGAPHKDLHSSESITGSRALQAIEQCLNHDLCISEIYEQNDLEVERERIQYAYQNDEGVVVRKELSLRLDPRRLFLDVTSASQVANKIFSHSHSRTTSTSSCASPSATTRSTPPPSTSSRSCSR